MEGLREELEALEAEMEEELATARDSCCAYESEGKNEGSGPSRGRSLPDVAVLRDGP